MVEQGLVRAREFTWEKAAEETLRVYRGVLAAEAAPGDMRGAS
jgi:hypothetical protein